ncbi:MAG: BlaI/MecI/CopY family transcriptional regulator, partial [Cyclobacteriaceae bacterium]|nr:BlaI/MecI/CopY family transcriptional regulator [Cyclobacteriaceae bacterium]
MLGDKRQQILKVINANPLSSSKDIYNLLDSEIGYSTIKRLLTQLIEEKLVLPKGKGKARKYIISPFYSLFFPIDVDLYFEKEIDEREIKNTFDLSLIKEVLFNVSLFSDEELYKLNTLQEKFKKNISELTEFEYIREFERLAIDLSWKSSQIEGNTYSLLETERLLKEKETAKGKTKDDAVMLLNHKEAIDFIIE